MVDGIPCSLQNVQIHLFYFFIYRSYCLHFAHTKYWNPVGRMHLQGVDLCDRHRTLCFDCSLYVKNCVSSIAVVGFETMCKWMNTFIIHTCLELCSQTHYHLFSNERTKKNLTDSNKCKKMYEKKNPAHK